MSEGGTKKSRLDSLEKSITEEQENWTALGISPQQVGADQFYLHSVSIALFRIIKDMLGVDEDEMNIILRETVLEQMQEMRENVEPQVRAARLSALQQAIVPQIIPPWQKGNGN